LPAKNWAHLGQDEYGAALAWQPLLLFAPTVAAPRLPLFIS